VKRLLTLILFSICVYGAVKLLPEEFVVKARVARYWKFNVTGDSGRVVGKFRASGGAHNDIRAVITDADECENYVNGNQAAAFYDSGQKTVATIDVRLQPGRYCIIFDNRNSVVSAKEVSAQIFLGE
jgi:hypothetical protein